jgi:hypothetical protein
VQLPLFSLWLKEFQFRAGLSAGDVVRFDGICVANDTEELVGWQRCDVVVPIISKMPVGMNLEGFSNNENSVFAGGAMGAAVGVWAFQHRSTYFGWWPKEKKSPSESPSTRYLP